MLEFLTTYLFSLVNDFLQQTYGIPKGTHYVPLHAHLFLYSYEANFIQVLLEQNEKKLARYFNFTFRYIDDVLSLNNYRICDFVDRIYPIELVFFLGFSHNSCRIGVCDSSRCLWCIGSSRGIAFNQGSYCVRFFS